MIRSYDEKKEKMWCFALSYDIVSLLLLNASTLHWLVVNTFMNLDRYVIILHVNGENGIPMVFHSFRSMHDHFAC